VRSEVLRVPPRTTAIGALAFYVSHADPHDYQPTNITFGIMEPPAGHIRDKQKRKLAISERALADLDTWKEHEVKGEQHGIRTSSVAQGFSPATAKGA
jgi:methylenetetrahydrofolate--tRNA-(uracil-5-)-methyltransferase